MSAAPAIDAATEYVELVARIHEVYRNLEMDTPKDREIHAKHIETADQALTFARRMLAAASPPDDADEPTIGASALVAIADEWKRQSADHYEVHGTPQLVNLGALASRLLAVVDGAS